MWQYHHQIFRKFKKLEVETKSVQNLVLQLISVTNYQVREIRRNSSSPKLIVKIQRPRKSQDIKNT